MNVYFDVVAHGILIDEGKRITTLPMPKEIEATEIITMISSSSFIPVIDAITKNQTQKGEI